jgi:hypothetical protein
VFSWRDLWRLGFLLFVCRHIIFWI